MPGPMAATIASMPAPTASSRLRYTGPAIALHWLLALMIVAPSASASTARLASLARKTQLYAGTNGRRDDAWRCPACALMWRLTHRPPPDVAMPAWQATAAMPPMAC